MKNVLSIAGVDPSGGAGIIADLKVFIAHDVFAMGVVTATTAQNTQGLFGMQLIDTKMIEDGIKRIFDDIRVDAIKIGVVPSVEIIKTVANTLKSIPNLPPVVLDPVMSCKNGDIWLEENSQKTLVSELFPISYVITPNLYEAQQILQTKLTSEDDFKDACINLTKFDAKNIYLKAGDVNGISLDVFYDGKDFELLKTPRINSNHTHGTGCSLSSAIAANLANGESVKNACKKAKEYITGAISHPAMIGSGCNPIDHFYKNHI